MKPGTVWIAIVLLALGVCGILDAAGVVDSSQTIGQWWPLAVVGWAVAEHAWRTPRDPGRGHLRRHRPHAAGRRSGVGQ